jgi:hypothetical protein
MTERSRFQKVSAWSNATIVSVSILVVLLWAVAMLTQHLWAPFADLAERKETLVYLNGALHASIDSTVYRRYPVMFRERIVHLKTGRWYALQEHAALTARTGRFILPKVFELPEGYLSGRYCHITEYTVTYNMLNTQFGVFEPACVDVRNSG